eukprot:1334589-Rhodomonas_salina.2
MCHLIVEELFPTNVEGKFIYSHVLGLAPREPHHSHNDLLQTLLCEEWCALKKTWGTDKPQEIQLALLLATDHGYIETPISNLLCLLGLQGITFYWRILPGQYRPPQQGKEASGQARLASLLSHLNHFGSDVPKKPGAPLPGDT